MAFIAALAATAWGEQESRQTIYGQPYEVVYTPLPERGKDYPHWEWGLNAGYGFKSPSKGAYATDLFGAEMRGAYYFLPHHAVTATLGVALGNHGSFPEEGNRFSDGYSLVDCYLMAGYQASIPLGKRMMLSFGAKGGADLQDLDLNYGKNYLDDIWLDEEGWVRKDYRSEYKKHDLALGLGYAAYVDLSYRLGEERWLTICYQFRGATTQPGITRTWEEGAFKQCTPEMQWHEVRVGLMWRF